MMWLVISPSEIVKMTISFTTVVKVQPATNSNEDIKTRYLWLSLYYFILWHIYTVKIPCGTTQIFVSVKENGLIIIFVLETQERDRRKQKENIARKYVA